MDLSNSGGKAGSIAQILRDQAVFPVYQPIWDLMTEEVVGVEALARGPAGTAVESAPALFAAAAAAGLLSELDQLCFTRAIELVRELDQDVPPLLFANAEPAVVNASIAPQLLAAVRSPRPFGIVAEYTERALAAKPAALVRLARLTHNDGNAVAMDDVGAEPLSLAFLPLLEPDVIKLDLSLLRDSHTPRSVETVAIVGAYAERTGAVILAEGIETESDLRTARGLGARWGQGWLLGRPGPLTTLTGLPMRHGTQLPQPPTRYDVLGATPFGIAAEGNYIRPGDRRSIEEMTDYRLTTATSKDPHTVVLGAYPDDAIAETCLPRLAAMKGVAAFVGVVPRAQAQRHPDATSTIVGQAGSSQTTLAVVSPYAAVALCARAAAGGGYDVVVTHDPDRVHAIARLLLGGAPGFPHQSARPL